MAEVTNWSQSLAAPQSHSLEGQVRKQTFRLWLKQMTNGKWRSIILTEPFPCACTLPFQTNAKPAMETWRKWEVSGTHPPANTKHCCGVHPNHLQPHSSREGKKVFTTTPRDQSCHHIIHGCVHHQPSRNKRKDQYQELPGIYHFTHGVSTRDLQFLGPKKEWGRSATTCRMLPKYWKQR